MFLKWPTRANLIWQLGLTGATLGWMVFIFYLSSLSQQEASKTLESGAVSWLGDIRSYVAHVVLYGVLAALIQGSLWGWNLGYQLRWAVLAAVVAALYGVSDEFHQSFVAGRSSTLVDGPVAPGKIRHTRRLVQGSANVKLGERPFQ